MRNVFHDLPCTTSHFTQKTLEPFKAATTYYHIDFETGDISLAWQQQTSSRLRIRIQDPRATWFGNLWSLMVIGQYSNMPWSDFGHSSTTRLVQAPVRSCACNGVCLAFPICKRHLSGSIRVHSCEMLWYPIPIEFFFIFLASAVLSRAPGVTRDSWLRANGIPIVIIV